MPYTALLDACVLHPIMLCDLLLRLAVAGLYRARWSSDILSELVTSLVRRGLPRDRVERRVALMNEALDDAIVEGYADLAASLADMVGDDAHVLAAAVIGGADVIVTSNVRDFPTDQLSRYRLIAQPPDDFLVHQWWLQADTVMQAVLDQAAETRRPPLTPQDVLTRLDRIIPQFVALARGKL